MSLIQCPSSVCTWTLRRTQVFGREVLSIRPGLVSDVSRLESEKRSLAKHHMEELRQIREGYDNQIRKMRMTHITETARIQEERENERERMADRISQMAKTFKSEKDQMEQDFHSTIVRMEMDFNDEKSQLQSDHVEQQVRLKRDIEALNGAPIAREHFKPLSDHDLKSRFSDLVDDIDYIARLEWKYNQTDWTNELLGQVSKNQRKLKKHILQESMWIALYENIFCSPFRVFGQEGRSLETQWTDAFGQGRYSSFALLGQCADVNRLPTGERILYLAETQPRRGAMEIRDHQAVSRGPGETSF